VVVVTGMNPSRDIATMIYETHYPASLREESALAWHWWLNAGCPPKSARNRLTRLKNSRAAVKVFSKAQLTGVAFFDFFHHQTGVAPNEIELHPLLAFKCVS
jgi:hypothetical protein